MLVRSLFECLGNVMALTASRRAFVRFIADGYRNAWLQLQVQRETFGDRSDWREWLANMDLFLQIQADWADLDRSSRTNPSKIVDWPSPYYLTRPYKLKGDRVDQPLLYGNRAELFEDARRLWYSVLSSYAHQRSAAAQMAVFANSPDDHEEPGGLESDVISQAMLFYACIMSELQAASEMPPSTDLPVLWSLLWDIDEHAKRFVRIRYRKLLRLPPFGG